MIDHSEGSDDCKLYSRYFVSKPTPSSTTRENVSTMVIANDKRRGKIIEMKMIAIIIIINFLVIIIAL